MRHWLRITFSFGLILLTAGFLPKITFETAQVTLKTASQDIFFTVEIADTSAKRSKGLMKREVLAIDHGMLFVFEEEKMLSFWMKDTPLPLDIIFFDRDGEYVSHYAGAVPYSEESIRSVAPAQYALEVNAGLTEEKQIGEGSLLVLPEGIR